jgi:hypothetical protein
MNFGTLIGVLLVLLIGLLLFILALEQIIGR